MLQRRMVDTFEPSLQSIHIVHSLKAVLAVLNTAQWTMRIVIVAGVALPYHPVA